MSEEHYNNPDYWHSTLPFKASEMQGVRVDITFSDGKTTDAKFDVKAHRTNSALYRVSVFVDGIMLGPQGGPCRQIIELRAHELSALAIRQSWDSVERFCLPLDASRWAEAVPLPRR